MHLRCIGRLNAAGEISGVVGYDGYNGSSVLMHVAGEGNWINRDLLRAAFDYPFNVMDCTLVLGMVPSGNISALRLNTHLGFRVINNVHGAHPDGSLYLMSMYRDECRFLPKGRPARSVNQPEVVQHLLQ